MKFLLKIFFYLICMFMVLYYIIQHSYIIDTWITGYAIPENDGWGVLLLSTTVTLMSLPLNKIYYQNFWPYPFVISMIFLLFFTQLTHVVINIAYKNSSGFFFTSFCNIIALMIYWGGKVITSIILNWLNSNNNKITWEKQLNQQKQQRYFGSSNIELQDKDTEENAQKSPAEHFEDIKHIGLSILEENIQKSPAEHFEDIKHIGLFILLVGIMIVSTKFIVHYSPGKLIEDEKVINSILSTGISSNITPGDHFSVSSTADISSLQSQDYSLISDRGTIGGEGQGLFIWDYYKEDGDYVQVYLDNIPCGKPFMIYNKPKRIILSRIGTKLEIKGIRDGGGSNDIGITYAINLPYFSESFFNKIYMNEANKYFFEKPTEQQ